MSRMKGPFLSESQHEGNLVKHQAKEADIWAIDIRYRRRRQTSLLA
ncbi:hypothetical protein [Desulfopila aestuarii]|uniref:Uncharacterized protein n=1 Tax=Desulfopila aestuarii DSM 18488 TaxID=1121416 RepID=A0A1M7YF95_9BACT|nr:hypothetical protein [Desulfopila aestuarii]SHO51290.1 hypothetical protein SAMN02745220_03936 [Desulfopila aestuarii DSM 18488]